MTTEEKLKQEIEFNEKLRCHRVVADRIRRLVKLIGQEEFDKWNKSRNNNA